MQNETHKKVKMQYLHRPSAKTFNGYRRVPFLRLSGNWLAQVGFSIGSIVEIITSENQLIIKKENTNEYE
jgi:toxic protein SymE